MFGALAVLANFLIQLAHGILHINPLPYNTSVVYLAQSELPSATRQDIYLMLLKGRWLVSRARWTDQVAQGQRWNCVRSAASSRCHPLGSFSLPSRWNWSTHTQVQLVQVSQQPGYQPLGGFSLPTIPNLNSRCSHADYCHHCYCAGCALCLPYHAAEAGIKSNDTHTWITSVMNRWT